MFCLEQDQWRHRAVLNAKLASHCMRACGHFAMRLAGLLGICPLMLSLHASAASTGAEKSEAPQVVMLVQGRSLIEHRLPNFIEVQPGRYLAASTLQRACTMPSLRADSLLLFLPDLQLCEQVSVPERVALRQRLQKLTGRWPTQDPLLRLREQPVVAIAPRPALKVNSNTACTCTPPNGVVMCSAQARTASTPIAPVEYLAADADGEALTGAFSYQFNADPVVDGLPSPLTSACTPAPGALQCTISGSAPAQPGKLQLMLTVSDGITAPDLQLTSLLQVLAVSDRVFTNGFENPATLSCRN
jgi:hypothetical protein